MTRLKYLLLLWKRALLMINSKSKRLGRNDASQRDLINTTTEILKMEISNG